MVRFTIVGLATLAALAPDLAAAQSQRSGGTPNAQIMQQYQQLSAERVALQTENARLKQEAADATKQLDALRKERDGLKAKFSHSDAEVAQARASSQSSEAALAKSRQSLEELIARYRELASQLKNVEEERARQQQASTLANRSLDACAVSNAGLYEFNDEVLKRWEHEGFFAALGRQDSFFRLKRTELENLVDDYRDRAEQLKVKPRPDAAPAGAAPHGTR